MGVGDKMKHMAEAAKGKVKAETGDKTGNKDLKARGRTEKTKADLKQAGESTKDAAKKAKDAFKD